MKKILVLAAHPDDETLGCGGTIHKLSKNYIKLLTFTNGTSARIARSKSEGGDEYNRNDKLKKVCDILGIDDYVYGDFPDNRMDTVSLLDICKFIESNVDFVPDIIFTHHRNCLNIDHQIVYRATITAFRPQYGNKMTIYSYFVPSSTDYNPFNEFVYNSYFVLGKENIDKKIESLKEYDEEIRSYPHTRSYENIINISKVNGCNVGVEHAECFEIVRSIL